MPSKAPGPEPMPDAPPPPAYAQQAYAPQVYAAPPASAQGYPAGYAAPPPYAVPRDPGTAKNWMNTVALIASLATVLTGIGWLAGIIFGHLGVSAANRGEADNKGMGVAGLIIGYVLGISGFLIIVGLFALPFVLAGQCVGADAPDWCTSPTYEYEYDSE